MVKPKQTVAASVLVVSMLGGGGMPWLAGVPRRVYFDHVLDGTETWYRVCTEGTFGACEDSEHFRSKGPRRVELLMRFRPGSKRVVTVAACNADGCSKAEAVEADVPVEWDF